MANTNGYLDKAGRIFQILALNSLVVTTYYLTGIIGGGGLLGYIIVLVSGCSAVIHWYIGMAIKNNKTWAKVLGIVISIVWILGLGNPLLIMVGTVVEYSAALIVWILASVLVGIVALYHLTKGWKEQNKSMATMVSYNASINASITHANESTTSQDSSEDKSDSDNKSQEGTPVGYDPVPLIEKHDTSSDGNSVGVLINQQISIGNQSPPKKDMDTPLDENAKTSNQHVSNPITNPESGSTITNSIDMKLVWIPTFFIIGTVILCTIVCLVNAEKAFSTWENSIGMKLVWILPGTFQMGSNDGEGFEKPRHTVKISKGFYMGIYEVTQEQYQKVMGTNPSMFNGSNLPVEQVSWDDAVEFCKNLSQKEGKTYRLPTEAEWEYACRAGTTSRYSFGDSESQLGDYAWYNQNSGNTTHPVGEKKPNAWGLYDMHGNVWEWCQDWYAEDWYSKGPMENPLNESYGDKIFRVVRGGSCVGGSDRCRVWFRDFIPIFRINGFGFRVVLDPDPEGLGSSKVSGKVTTFSTEPSPMDSVPPTLTKPSIESQIPTGNIAGIDGVKRLLDRTIQVQRPVTKGRLLKIGMSKSEVLNLLGEPDRVSAYTLSSGTKGEMWFYWESHGDITFKNEYVDEWSM
jgi:formylglycine-generating enzyme required for sulfatase activity